MSIYIITHKVAKKYGDAYYKFLHVGSSLTDQRFGKEYLLDSSGENISKKNKSFCELTGLYWIWKNVKDDIVGLEHYRRYLVEPGEKVVPARKETIIRLLDKSDIILPEITHQPNSVKYGWSLIHHNEDMDVVRDVILEKYPDYVADFDNIMSLHQLYICNMMICQKELCDQYCEWLFNILFEVEKRVDISNYDTMQKRLFGFISERLLNIWVLHNHLRITELKLINTEKRKFSKITSKLYNIARYVFHIDILYFQVHRKLKIYHDE